MDIMNEAIDREGQLHATAFPRISALTDEQLLLRYRETGDRDLFALLVRRYERELYSYLRRYLGNPELAEDAFQAAFLQVHLKCDTFEPDRRFRPWLYTIATNQAIDVQRRNRRHRLASLDSHGSGAGGDEVGKLLDLVASSEPSPMAEAGAAERRQWVREAMDELPEHLAGAVRLVYYQGLKYREAADVLGVPVGTVKSRLHAAILKLNEAWHSTHAE
jgi:RNA polymerase sigma-70 factor (ECF subfamily)